MSHPTVAEGFAWMFLILLTALSFGAGSMNFTTTVCNTKQGNNTQVSYNVSRYNETILVLSCTGEADRTAIWTRADGSVLCGNRSCTINSGRRLTNDDSGVYLCKASVENGTEHQFIHINVLAPPKLTNIIECHGNNKDKCTLEQNTDFVLQSPYTIGVNYTGNGPFHVDWYHNGAKFECSDSKACRGLDHGTTYQTLKLESDTLEEAKMMSGLYSAFISNIYGTNKSLIRLEYSCVPRNLPNPTELEITVDLQEGSMLNDSCDITIQSDLLMYACITNNLSATFDDLQSELSYGGCAVCNGVNDLGHKCTDQFNSSITNISISKLEDGGCPAKQMMNFLKNNVTVDDDNGTKIICAYATINEVKPYASIYLKVSRPPNNRSSHVSVTVSSIVVSSIVILAVALTIGFCVVLRKRKRQQHNEGTNGFIHASGPQERSDSGYEPEDQPLIDSYNDQYGAISLIGDYRGELESEEPSAVV